MTTRFGGETTRFEGNASNVWVYLLFIAVAVLGYGFYIRWIGVLDDDIAGRFQGIINKTSIDKQIEIFRTWRQGRPVVHASNATFETMFSDFPEYVVCTVAFIALTAQAYVLYWLGLRIGLPKTAAVVGALIFLMTPAAVSLNLVIHGLGTEWSTWFMLIATALVLRDRPLLAGAACALQINNYETYLTIFFLPFAFLIVKRVLAGDFSFKVILIEFAKYAVAFAAVAALSFSMRFLLGGQGREAMLAGMSVFDIVWRMVSAAFIGSFTNLKLHIDSLYWALTNGPRYIVGFAVALLLVSYLCCVKFLGMVASDSSHDDRYITRAGVIAIGLGAVLVPMSYMIFFAERYPPNFRITRLANIHAGSRFGIYFLTIGIVLLAHNFRSVLHLSEQRSLKVASAVLAAAITSFVSFNHAYSYQEMLSTQKKYGVVDALQFACERTTSDNTIFLVVDDEFGRFVTDPVLSWTTPYLGITSFHYWDTKFVLVSEKNAPAVKSLLAAPSPVDMKMLSSLVHVSFVRFPWLYPWGDIARWTIDKGAAFMVESRYENGYFSTHVLTDPASAPLVRQCHPRAR